MLALYKERDDFTAQVYMHAVKLTMPDLRGDFTRAAPRQYEFSKPAKRLEQRHGLSGIAQDYKLPFGLSEIDLQAFCMLARALRNDLQGSTTLVPSAKPVIDKVIKLNPELHQLHFDKTDSKAVYDVLLGVASGFNPTDIQHFVDGNHGVKSRTLPGYQDKLDQIERSLGLHAVCWVPASATLDKIISQLPKNQGPKI